MISSNIIRTMITNSPSLISTSLDRSVLAEMVIVRKKTMKRNHRQSTVTDAVYMCIRARKTV